MGDNPKYVLCVCTANICRSPLAERLLQHALAAEEEPLKSLKVISAGVSAYEGEPASEHSVKVLKKVGLDLSDHRSRRLNPQLLDRAVLIVCMTESHRQAILRQFPELDAPIILMRELLDDPAEREIPDPYGLNLPVYEACRDAIVEAIPSIIEHLKTLTKKET